MLSGGLEFNHRCVAVWRNSATPVLFGLSLVTEPFEVFKHVIIMATKYMTAGISNSNCRWEEDQGQILNANLERKLSNSIFGLHENLGRRRQARAYKCHRRFEYFFHFTNKGRKYLCRPKVRSFFPTIFTVSCYPWGDHSGVDPLEGKDAFKQFWEKERERDSNYTSIIDVVKVVVATTRDFLNSRGWNFFFPLSSVSSMGLN